MNVALYQADNTDPSSKLPYIGLPSSLLVTAEGDTEGILITRFALLGINGEIIFESGGVGRFGSTDMYGIFGLFLPTSTFQVQISGVDRLGNQVSRISTTGAQPSTVDLRLGKIIISVKNTDSSYT